MVEVFGLAGRCAVAVLLSGLVAACDDGFDGSGQPQSPEYFARVVAGCIAEESQFYGDQHSWEANLKACIRWTRCLGQSPYMIALERKGVISRDQFDLASGYCATDRARPDLTGRGTSRYAGTANRDAYLDMIRRLYPDRLDEFQTCLTEGELDQVCEARIDFAYPHTATTQ